MKNLLLFFLLVSQCALAQSNSFQSLRENFKGEPEVVTLSVKGFFLKTALRIIEQDEDENWIKGVRDIKHLRFMHIPIAAFEERGLKLNSFKKYVMKDEFEQLLKLKDGSDDIEIYIQEGYKNNNRYLVIVDQSSDVNVFEVTGYIDIEKIIATTKKPISTQL